jgi:hypothetical protein
VNGTVYISCATASAKIENGILAPWGIETPAGAVQLVPTTTGVMTPGDYQVAVTYVLSNGTESRPSLIATVTIPANTGAGAGLIATSIPLPASPYVVSKRIYMSTADGEELYLVAEHPASTAFASFGLDPTGPRLLTAELSPIPNSIALANYGGRIFFVPAATPNVVGFTEAFGYDHTNLAANYYQFPAPVTVIAAVTDGLYVCADKTYFLAHAGSSDATQAIVLDFGAVYGSAVRIPQTATSMWLSPKGSVVGGDGGGVTMAVEASISVPAMSNAAGMYREQDGIKQFVVTGQNGAPGSLQAQEYTAVEVARRNGN